MQKLTKALFFSAAVFGAAVTAQAQNLPLPGKTLKQPVANRAGIEQPAKNVKNILGGQVSPLCPHLNKTLRELLNYARVNHPALYRQALALRRGAGFSQEQVRVWLEDNICTAEGF